MGIGGAPSDLFAKLAAAGMAPAAPRASRNKRKFDCCSSESPVLHHNHQHYHHQQQQQHHSKHARIDHQDVKNKKMLVVPSASSASSHHDLRDADDEGDDDPDEASGSPAAEAADAIGADGRYEDGAGLGKRRILPLCVSTIDVGMQDVEATHPWNVFTKGFFYSKGSDLRAGYWVYYGGHCVANALVWNNEFGEIRYDHQGHAACMRGLNKASVSPVSIGLMAILDAIAWARSLLSFAHWHVYCDNLEALKLVDMYQRNLQFMKFHCERPLLDSILDAAQTGHIHLHRR